VEDGGLPGSGLGAPQHGATWTHEVAQLHPLQFPAQVAPAVLDHGLHHPGQHRTQATEGDVGPDAILLAVVAWTQVQHLLPVAPGSLHLERRVIERGQLRGGERVIGRAKQELAVQALLGPELGSVRNQPWLLPAGVAGEGGVEQQLGLGPPPGIAPLAVDGGQLHLRASLGRLTAGSTPPLLPEGAADHRAALPGQHLLHLEVLLHHPAPTATDSASSTWGNPARIRFAHDVLAAVPLAKLAAWMG